jgi:hypothetical protein
MPRWTCQTGNTRCSYHYALDVSLIVEYFVIGEVSNQVISFTKIIP